MIRKSLKKTEVLKGFIQLPVNGRQELIGELPLPFQTKLNDSPARLDKQGRLWSAYLRNKYVVGTEVAIDRIGDEYKIKGNGEIETTMVEITETDNDIPNNEAEINTDTWHRLIEGDCLKYLDASAIGNVHLTFFDPPYNQGKSYRFFDDNQLDDTYWKWVQSVLERIHALTEQGGAIYFMQREKNTERVLQSLRKAGWVFQNLIIWKKKTSAVPCMSRFSKQYQIIAYAIKGKAPRVFNKLRIDPPPLPEYKYQHDDGVYVTDVWDDVREMTSGYFAGDEAIRDNEGNRVHTQQSPISLLLRIVLSSSLPGDVVLDPVAGTGTTLVVAKQLERNSIGIEIDPAHVALIEKRLSCPRPSDRISRYLDYYKFTPNLKKIWRLKNANREQKRLL